MRIVATDSGIPSVAVTEAVAFRAAGFGAGSNRILYIGYVDATRDKRGRSSNHTVPNRTCIVESIFSRPQQVTLESLAEGTVNVFAGFEHGLRSSRNTFVYNESLKEGSWPGFLERTKQI